MCDCKQDVYGLKYAQLPVYQRISTTDHLLAPGTCRCRCSSFCFRSRPTSCLYTGHILIGSGCFGPAVDGALAERRHHAHAVDILALEASPATGVVAHADSQAAGFGGQIKTGPAPPPSPPAALSQRHRIRRRTVVGRTMVYSGDVGRLAARERGISG